MGTIQDMINKLENFQRDLQELGTKNVPIIPDANGMIDRQCPKNDCQSYFKVNSEDWKNIVKDEEVFCPICRNNSPANEYIPKAQQKEIVSGIRNLIMDNWHHGTPMSQNIAPIQSIEEFELNIDCENCKTRFSVIGAAFFCPCCGYNSVERTAKESIEKILLQMQKLTSIERSLQSEFTRDQVAVIIQSLIENSLCDCISTLQAYCESRYNHLSSTKAPFNVFQNIERGNKLWVDLNGKGYQNWLSKNEYNHLTIFAQRRHLLEHKNGFVDAKYINNTNDSNYKEGDRIIVKDSDVCYLGKIITKIINSIENP
jgi:uncharacterized Zn finger protein (UPF0148 family)